MQTQDRGPEVVFQRRSPFGEAIIKTHKPRISCKIKAQRRGFDFGRKNKGADTKLSPPSAEAECSEFVLTVARQEGFEPPTYCLEGSCSILLSYWRIYAAAQQLSRLSQPAETERCELPLTLERVMGIEPTYPAWKAGVLPLNYTHTSSHSAMR